MYSQFMMHGQKNIKLNVLCSFFFQKSCRSWDNVEKHYIAMQDTWHYCACALHAAYLRLQNTHIDCVILIVFSTVTLVTRMRLDGALYIRYVFCFPCIYKRMLRWFPSFQVATTYFSCSPADLNFLVTFFNICVHVK